MKPIRKHRFLLIPITAALILQSAEGAVISIALDNGSLGPEDLAGASGVRSANWNSWGSGNTTLGDNETIKDDSGATMSGLTVSINSLTISSRDNNTTNESAIFSDVLDVSGTRTITLSSIPFAEYEIYVYMRDDGANRAGSFTIGSTTYYARGGAGNPANDGTGYVLSTDTTAGTSGSNNGWDQGNYVKFTGLTSSSITMNWDVVNAGDAVQRNKVAGFQIVQVPEPSAAVLGLVGSLALLRRRRD